jgi:hypothetical protein
MQKQDQSQKIQALFSELQQVASEAGKVAILLPTQILKNLEYFCEHKDQSLATLCKLQATAVISADGNLHGTDGRANELVSVAFFAEQLLAGLSVAEYLPSQNSK